MCWRPTGPREFNPVKNASGDDSPETARAALASLFHGWLRAAGAQIDDATPVEISPLFALDAEEVRSQSSKPGHEPIRNPRSPQVNFKAETRDMLHAVVMAGGSGTRFWPQSRAALPKQFLNLFGEETLLQGTLSRVGDWISAERSWIVTNKAHAAQTQKATSQCLPAGNILQEPCGRNTAPCIGLAALAVAARDPEAVMLVMPADHFVPDPAAFRQAVERAVAIVRDQPQALILFGVRPTYACVSFGYIERGESRSREVHRTSPQMPASAWPRSAKSPTGRRPKSFSLPAGSTGTAASLSGRRRRFSTRSNASSRRFPNRSQAT